MDIISICLLCSLCIVGIVYVYGLKEEQRCYLKHIENKIDVIAIDAMGLDTYSEKIKKHTVSMILLERKIKNGELDDIIKENIEATVKKAMEKQE